MLVGWDTADWKIVSAMLDAGQLPCLAKLVGRGTTGHLTAMAPVLSPLLWTSIATGRRADGHNILTSNEPDPDTGGTRRSSSTSRTCKALWNILTQAGLRALAVNWVASHPAEPISGACVSDEFATLAGPKGHAWPLRPGAIHPARLEETLAALRVHPADIDGPPLLPFVPGLARVDRKVDRRPEILATQLAKTASNHAAATYLLEHEPCDVIAVRYNSFDHLAQHFLPFRPPRTGHVSEADFRLYQHVIAGVYRFHDAMLARLVGLAGPEATVIVVSDHGFSANHLRTPAYDRSRPATIISGHRADGFVVMAGPHVRRDEPIRGATVLDVTPTILTLLGLPVGEDQEGRPLLEALDGVTVPPRIPSWEFVAGDSGRHRRETREDTAEASEIIERLASLGYIEERAEDRERRNRLARQRTRNLAFSHLSANRATAALPFLERLAAEDPGDIASVVQLLHCYLLLGRNDKCRRVIDDVLARRVDRPSADLVRGNLELAEGRPDVDIAALLDAEEKKGKRPGLGALIGQCYLGLRRGGDAERAFRAVLASDEDFAPAHHGLAMSLLLQGRPSEAADEALAAIGLNDHFPQAHRALGLALTELGQVDRAVQAFETCLALEPSDTEARSFLDRLRRPAVITGPTGMER